VPVKKKAISTKGRRWKRRTEGEREARRRRRRARRGTKIQS
jgi:hypothetical protein